MNANNLKFIINLEAILNCHKRDLYSKTFRISQNFQMFDSKAKHLFSACEYTYL